jgi:hypothetical protein
MLIIKVPGTSGLTLQGAQNIQTDPEDSTIARLPHLRSFVDISALLNSGPDISKFGRNVVQISDGSLVARPGFNGRIVADLPTTLANILVAGVLTDSFTFITAIEMKTEQYFFTTSGNDYSGIAGGDDIKFRIESPGGVSSPQTNYSAPINTPTLVMVSFDSATQELAVATNVNPTPELLAVSGTTPALGYDLQFGRYGGNGSQMFIGDIMIFSEALHIAANAPTRIEAFAIMSARFGITIS